MKPAAAVPDVLPFAFDQQERKAALEAEAALCEKKLERATKLIGGLGVRLCDPEASHSVPERQPYRNRRPAGQKA